MEQCVRAKVQDAIYVMKNLGKSSPRNRSARPSRSHARWAGRRPTAIQAALRRRMRATLGWGGARKYRCDQTGCSGLSLMQQPASSIGAVNSPHDKSAEKRQSLETKLISRGTEGSNPAPSGAESGARRHAARGDGHQAPRAEIARPSSSSCDLNQTASCRTLRGLPPLGDSKFEEGSGLSLKKFFDLCQQLVEIVCFRRDVSDGTSAL